MLSRGKRILKLLEKKSSSHDEEDISNVVLRPDPADDCKIQKNARRLFETNQETQKVDNNSQQPSTSGIQNILTTSNNKDLTESSDEDVSSSSDYIPTSDDGDSDESIDNQKSTWKLQNANKVKRNIFSEKVDMFQKEELTVEINNDRGEIASQEQSTNIIEKPIIHITADIQVNEIKQKVFELRPKVSKKRTRNENIWKRKKAAMLRQKGEEYLSQTGKVTEKKVANQGVLCKENCRQKCTDKFSLEDRQAILKKFNSHDVNAKNALIFKSVNIQPVCRHRRIRNSSKTYSYRYAVSYNKQLISVCRDALCSLYKIGRKKIEITKKLLKSGQSAPTPDKRGRHNSRPHKISDDVINCIISHIKQFPAEESHYSRNTNMNKKYLSPLLNVTELHRLYIDACKERKLDNKFMVKVSFYRYIFDSKFNLSFGHPKSDTCSVCDAGDKSADHKENYEFAFYSQKVDRQISSVDRKTCYITMDLQQTMPLPKLSTSKAFYLRQMWFYNFGIHCITYLGHKSYFFNWTEDIANRGSNEIASCLLRFCKLLKEAHPDMEHLIIWSDSCAGQNKNFFIICLYQYLILNNVFKIIDHKFPEVGHSYLDSDRDFGRIEKALRKHQSVFILDQYRDIIKSASTKNSLCLNMDHFFYNFEELPANLNLFKKVKNTNNEKVNLRDNVKWIRVVSFGSYLYKTSIDPFTPFLEVDVLKKGNKQILPGEVTLNVLPKCGGLTVEKMSNLREQLKFINIEYRWFYEEVLNENIQNPKKKRKTY